MYAQPTLATRFARNTRVVRSEHPLAEDADAPGRAVHLRGGQARQPLRALHLHPHHRRAARPAREGFEPFMVAQGKSRIEGKTEFTKHMIRMRHVARERRRPGPRRTRSS